MEKSAAIIINQERALEPAASASENMVARVETLLGAVRNLHRILAVLIAITVVNGLATAVFVKSQFAIISYLLLVGVLGVALVFSIRLSRNRLKKTDGISVAGKVPFDISDATQEEAHSTLIPFSQTDSEMISQATLDVEKEIVVRMEPRSRRRVKVRINSIQRATPKVVYDPPDA